VVAVHPAMRTAMQISLNPFIIGCFDYSSAKILIIWQIHIIIPIFSSFGDSEGT
jgi:hypothetical protein